MFTARSGLRALRQAQASQLSRAHQADGFVVSACSARLDPTAQQASRSTGFSSAARSLPHCASGSSVCDQQRRQLFSFPGGNSAKPKEYHERKLLQFSPEQLYAVVAQVDTYKEFVPWCQRSVVTKVHSEERLDAELEVGFKMFVERYTSEVYLHKPDKVISRVSDSSLFDHLDTTWEFKPGPCANTCWLTFQTDFRFRSPLYGQVANVFFDEVVKRMMAAFESRCKQVYAHQQGPGGPQPQRYNTA